jgi:hypothetical protein
LPPFLSVRDLRLTLLAWLAISAVLVGFHLAAPSTAPMLAEGDDVMRMVMVQDVLNGAPWQSQGEPRDNTPYGGQMHWSALVTLPLAGLTAMLGPRTASIVWPLLLLLPLLLLTVVATRRLAPAAGPGTVAVLTAFNITAIAEFSPGRIDHHSVQMLLLQAVLVAMLLGRQKIWGGAIAGVMLATCLAIGLETLPVVVAAGFAFGLIWLIDPVGNRAGTLGFAAGFALGQIGHLLFATPLPSLFQAFCDTNSIVYVTAGCLAAVALAIAALTSSQGPLWLRIGVLSALSAVAIAITAVLFPACLSGPYSGVYPRMLSEVFPIIPEAKSFWERVVESPLTSIPFGACVLPAVAIAIAQVVRRKDQERIDWLVLLIMLGAATAVMLMEIRGARLAVMLGVPPAAWAIAELRRRYLTHRSLPWASALLAAWLVFASWVQALLFTIVSVAIAPGVAQAKGPTLADCTQDNAYSDLANLPPGRVAAPYILGPYILLHTRHEILSAGYHRNGKSVMDSVDFFDNDDRARAIAHERGLTYAVTCGTDPAVEQRSWLQPLPGTGPLRLYRIAP